MKTLLFALVLPFSMFFSGEQAIVSSDLNPPVEESYDLLRKMEIEVKIDFGRKEKNCRGLGICRLVIRVNGGEMEVIEGSGARGKLIIENGQVTNLFIHRASLNTETYKKYFSSGSFIASDEFSVTLNHKGQKIYFQLKAGKYPLKRTSTGFNLGVVLE